MEGFSRKRNGMTLSRRVAQLRIRNSVRAAQETQTATKTEKQTELKKVQMWMHTNAFEEKRMHTLRPAQTWVGDRTTLERTKMTGGAYAAITPGHIGCSAFGNTNLLQNEINGPSISASV